MLAPDPNEPKSGDRIGRYTVVSVLGRGGMGAVFEAEDSLLGRRAAIKLLPRHTRDDPVAAERFLVEARAAARLEHPNVVGVYEVGVHGKDRYIAMHLVRGGSAQAKLDAEGALPWTEAVGIVAQACKGLEAAHKAGVVHRDIKPGNLMLGGDGVTRVADFGLAKARGASGRQLTRTGVLLGTPQFMSPEQCQTETADARSDIYSLGATLYALLTGRPPYERGGTPQILYAQVYDPVPDPRQVKPELPAGCSAIVARAMAKVPDDRYGSAAEMRADLEAMLSAGELPVAAPGAVRVSTAPATVPRRAPVAKPRSRWVIGSLVAVGLALAAGIGAGVYATRRVEPGAAPPAPAPADPPAVEPAVRVDPPAIAVVDPPVTAPTVDSGVADEYSRLVQAGADARAARSPARLAAAAAALRRFAVGLDSGSPAERKFAAAARHDAEQLESGSTPPEPLQPPPSGDLPVILPRSMLTSHTGPVTVLQFSGDHLQRNSVSEDGTVVARNKVGKKGSTEERFRVPGLSSLSAMSLSHDRTLLAVGGREGIAVVLHWSTEATKPGDEVGRFPADCGRQGWLAFSPKEDVLALATPGAGGREVRLVHVRPNRSEPPIVRESSVVAAVWTPDGSRLVLALASGNVEFIDVKTRAVSIVIPSARKSPVCRMEFSPDGSVLMLGDEGGGLRLFSIAERAVKFEVTAHRGAISSIAFSPDGSRIATAARDRDVRYWSVSPLAPVAVLRSPTTSVISLAFRSDGNFLLGGTAGGEMQVWGLARLQR